MSAYNLPFRGSGAFEIRDEADCKMASIGSTRMDTRECVELRNFIVRACNSHAELLEACELVLDKVLSEHHSQDSPVRQKVEQAIAKAKGGTKP